LLDSEMDSLILNMINQPKREILLLIVLSMVMDVHAEVLLQWCHYYLFYPQHILDLKVCILFHCILSSPIYGF